MEYSIDAGIQVPYFVIHDKMENTHINQLRTIFEIVMILKDNILFQF